MANPDYTIYGRSQTDFLDKQQRDGWGEGFLDKNYHYCGSDLYQDFDFIDGKSGDTVPRAHNWNGRILPTSVKWYNRGPPNKKVYLYDLSGMFLAEFDFPGTREI